MCYPVLEDVVFIRIHSNEVLAPEQSFMREVEKGEMALCAITNTKVASRELADPVISFKYKYI